MRKQIFVRIDAFFDVFKTEALDSESINLITLGQRQIAFDVNKIAFLFQLGQDIFVQHVGNKFAGIWRQLFFVFDFSRMGKQVCRRQRRGNDGAVAVGDVGARNPDFSILAAAIRSRFVRPAA